MIRPKFTFKGDPSFENILKQFKFGTARGLTQTAKGGQGASQTAIKGGFTVRSNWWQQQNKYGVRVKPATKASLSATIETAADWLEKHEEGGTKTPTRGKAIAVPTANVRRNKRQIITRANRPRNIKGAFVINTRRGPVIFRRAGRGKNRALQALFGLESSAKIRRVSTFYDPITEHVEANVEKNVAASVEDALKSAK